jgi:transcriptional regulator with XRE-family HTH domain
MMMSRGGSEDMDTLELARTLIIMGFPERLSAIRKKRGLTQKSLAEVAGLSHIQVHRYENGSAQPTLEAIKRLAVALAVSTDELIFDENERGPSDDLRLQFESVSAFGESDRKVVKEVLDGLILKHQARRWISPEEAG